MQFPRPRHCDVAFLHPPENEASRFLEGRPDDGTLERLEEIMETIRTIVSEAAKQTGVETHVNEYQLHSIKGARQIAGARRRRSIADHDMIVTVDPDADLLAFMLAQQQRPLHRSVIAFTDPRELHSLWKLFGTPCVPLINIAGSQREAVSRVFALNTPRNRDDEADAEKANVHTMTRALRYPDINPRAYSNGLAIIDADMPESQPEFRPFLVQQTEDGEDA